MRLTAECEVKILWSAFLIQRKKTVCPSGLRGWTQVPLAQAAWVQIPQLSYPLSLPCLDTAQDNMSFPLLGALIMLPRRSWQSIRFMSAWSWVRSSQGGLLWGRTNPLVLLSRARNRVGRAPLPSMKLPSRIAGEEGSNPCMFPCPVS